MKKIVLCMLAGLLIFQLHAQQYRTEIKSQIVKGLKIKVKKINRVEKYGWDNLEVVYELTNQSDFNIRKLDFTVQLLDHNKNEVGSVEVHAFGIPKESSRTLKYADVGNQFVNTKFQDFTTSCTLIDVELTGEHKKVVSIKGTELVKHQR